MKRDYRKIHGPREYNRGPLQYDLPRISGVPKHLIYLDRMHFWSTDKIRRRVRQRPFVESIDWPFELWCVNIFNYPTSRVRKPTGKRYKPLF